MIILSIKNIGLKGFLIIFYQIGWQILLNFQQIFGLPMRSTELRVEYFSVLKLVDWRIANVLKPLLYLVFGGVSFLRHKR